MMSFRLSCPVALQEVVEAGAAAAPAAGSGLGGASLLPATSRLAARDAAAAAQHARALWAALRPQLEVGAPCCRTTACSPQPPIDRIRQSTWVQMYFKFI